MIRFTKRARVRQCAAGLSKTYRSVCGDFAVIYAKPLGYPAVWLAVMLLANGNQQLISRHRKREAAERACQ